MPGPYGNRRINRLCGTPGSQIRYSCAASVRLRPVVSTPAALSHRAAENRVRGWSLTPENFYRRRAMTARPA